MTSFSRKLLVMAPLVLTIVLAKFSFPPFSTMGLGIALPLVLLTTFLGMSFGAFRLNLGRLYLYLLLAIWACTTQLFGKPFSLTSLLFLLGIFFPYVLQLKPDPLAAGAADDGRAARDAFADIGLFMAVLGCAQYAAQFAVGPQLAFPIEHLLPKGILIEYFNYLNTLYYGSSIYKANGVFFLEPSFFSQFIAVSLLVELSGKSRWWRVAIHLAALACTFSGTGLIVLGAGALTLVVVHRRWDLVGLALVAALAAAWFGDALRLSIFLDRSSEFAKVGSSGFERFVAWTYMLQDQFWEIPSRVWTGYGAGSFSAMSKVARYNAWESSFAKILFEFGIPGMVFYFSFLVYCIGSGSVSAAVKAGLVVCLLMNGPYSESNAGILLSLLLWPAAAREAGAHVAAGPVPRHGPAPLGAH